MRYKVSLYKISVQLFFLLVCCSLIPQIKALAYFNQLWLVLCVSWLVLTYFSCPEFYRKQDILRFATLIFIIYTVFIPYLTGNKEVANRYLEYSQVFIFYWAFLLGKKKDNGRLNSKLITLLIPVVLYVSLVTLNEYMSNPIVSRAVKPATEQGQTLLVKGIGGYDFVYFLAIIFTILIYSIRHSSFKFSIKALLVLFALVISINVLLSGFMTASLILFTGLFSYYFVPSLNRGSVLLIPLILIFLYIFSINIIDFLIMLFELYNPDSLNVSRLIELKNLFESGIVQSSINERFLSYQKSVQTIIEKPILGVIYNDFNQPGEILSLVSQHSFILDTSAFFGVFFGLLFFVLLSSIILQSKDKLNPKNNLHISILILAFLLLMLNNFTPSIGFALFFIYPVINNSIQKS